MHRPSIKKSLHRLTSSFPSSPFWSRDQFNGSSEEEEILWLMLFAFVCFVCAAVHTTQEPTVVIPKVCIKLEVCLICKWILISVISIMLVLLVAFGSSVTLFQPRRTDYVHHFAACPPRFENVTASAFCILRWLKPY